jgi:3-dehydroquinate synthase
MRSREGSAGPLEQTVLLFPTNKSQYRSPVTSIEIQSARHSYRVLIAADLLARAGQIFKEEKLPPGRCAIISDTNVGPLFAGGLAKNLRSTDYEPKLITVPAGEESKTLEQAGQICEQMLSAGLDRESFVVGLGGGVIGDLSGFVAAIFERGIPHVQIPTTLLAMVDSSIGGKTGVNARAGKNLIGAFHPPRLVIDDIDVLKTLLQREVNQGFAEIIKHALIADAEMFRDLEELASPKLDCFTPSSLEELIRRNVKIKARIVEKDEHERQGQRPLLNFGHTVGHAIERAADYRGIAHGEAVSLGIVAACEISMKKAGLPKQERKQIADLLRKFGLPIQLPKDLSREKILEALKLDKKFMHGRIRFVVVPKIGSAQLSEDVTTDDIREAVEKL